MGRIEGAARDNTDDWTLPPEARPATVADLERRIDHALGVARASEAAALEIGAAALEAAEQARRAAELAECASARSPLAGPDAPAPAPDSVAVTDSDQLWLRSFDERADRLLARFGRMGSTQA